MPAPRQRLLIDPPGPGAWNMAVDEVLLEWAAECGGCAWRFYQWSEPTLSLGYFQETGDGSQESGDRSQETGVRSKYGVQTSPPYSVLRTPYSALPTAHCPLPTPSSAPPTAHCPLPTGIATVRRLTGGGAILHDRELTYSLLVPADHALAARRETMYDAVHRGLIETLAGLGVTAVLCSPDKKIPSAAEPFLCFQRRAFGDVLVGETKIAGSAQRRRRGAVLQHGGVLLGRSPAAPELPGLEDAAGVAVSPDQLAEAWLAKLTGRLGIAWQRDGLTEAERRRAAELAEARYGAAAWTQHRDRPTQHETGA